MRTDVHTFAFSVAANSILSFFPFVVLMMTLIRRVFHSRVMYEVVVQLLRDYLPAGQDFVIRNLNSMVNSRQRVQVVSLVILLVTSSGVFLPLEVALNRIWRFENNRSYLGNQLVSLGLAFACGAARAALDRADSGPGRLHGVHAARLRYGFRAGGGVSDDEGVRDRGEHRHLLPDLLGCCPTAKFRPAPCCRRHHHGIAIRSSEVRLHPRAAVAEFSGSLRTVRSVGDA